MKLVTAYRLYVTLVFAVVIAAKIAGIVAWLASKVTITSAKTAYVVFRVVFRAAVLVGMYVVAPQLTLAYIIFSLALRAAIVRINR